MKKQLKFLFVAFLLLTAGMIAHMVYAADDPTPVAVLSSDKKTLTFLNAVKKDATSATDSSGTVYSGTVYSDVARGAAQSSDPSDIADTQDEYLNGNDYRSYKDAAKTVTKIVIKDKLSLKTDAFAFADFTELTEIDGLKNLNATDSMAGLVYGDSKLTKLDMSDIDMTDVTNFAYAFSKTDNLAEVVFGKTGKPVNFFHAFEDAKAVIALDLSGMSFSNLNHAFSGASCLTSVTLPDKFGAENMSYLFNDAEKLNTLDGSKFDTSKATDLSYAFNDTSSLLKLDTSSWDLSNATAFDHFFNGSAVSAIDFSKAKIASGNFANAFSANKHLTSLDLSGVAKATSVASLVSGDSKLLIAKVPFDTSQVTDFSKAFYGTGLTTLDISKWNTSNAKTMDLMFASSSDLEEVTFGKNFAFKGTTLPIASNDNGFTGKWHSPDGTDYTASEMAALPSNKLEGTWHWSGEDKRTAYYAVVTDDSFEVIKGLMSTASKDKVTDADSGKVYTGKVYNLAEVLDGRKVPWAGDTAIKTATIHTKYYFGEHADYFFAGLSNLTQINGLENLDFTHTLTATHFFDGAGLTTLDATVWDDGTNPATTSNIKDASYFFANMSNLTNLTIVAEKYGSTHAPVFDLRSATNLSHLFENDSKITKLVLSEFIYNWWHYYGLKASNVVQNTAYMFAGMSNVTSILGFLDGNGDFSNVIDATAMFKGDSNLTDFGGYAYTDSKCWQNSFRFSKIQKADEMFAGVGLKTLDLGRFNGSSLTSAKNMFEGDSITRFLDNEGNFTMNGFDFEDSTAIDDNYSGNWVNSKNNTTYTPAEMKTYKGVFNLTPELTTDDGEKQTDLSGTAYAVLDGNTLKFIRSKESPKDGTIEGIDGVTYKGTIYTGFENSTSVPWYNDNFTTVKFVNAIRPTTVNSWFKNKANLVQVIGGQNLNLSQATDMSYMFYGDTKLARVNTSDWDTSSATNMSWMFGYCSSLVNLNTSKWDTSQVTDMGNMFNDCSNLADLDVSKWNTGNVTSMSGMFNGCSSLVNLNTSNWDTRKVTDMGWMFESCSSLTNLDVSKWDTSKVTTINWMFDSCSSLVNLDVSKWDTSQVTGMGGMFHDCSSLTNLDVSNWNTNKATDMGWMFESCSSLTNLDVSKWDTSQVTYMREMLLGCSNLTNLDVSNWNTSEVTNMSGTFGGCSSLTNLDVSKWNTSKVTTMNGMFEGCPNLTNLDVSKWDTSEVTIMSGTFNGCSSLTNLDVSNWDTSQVTDMNWMFQNCSSLTNLDVSKWNTSQVTNMSNMFNGCSNLASVGDLSKWNTSKVTYIGCMFQNCGNLTALGDLSGWNVSNVQDSSSMFANDKALTNVDVHTWKLANTTNAAYMFSHCENLPSSNVSGIAIGSNNKTLDHTFADCYTFSDFDASNISASSVLNLNCTFGQSYYDNGVSHMKIKSITGLDKWDTNQVTSMVDTFYYDGSLTDFDLSTWNTENVTDMHGMFEGVGVKKLDLSNFKGNKVANVAYMVKNMQNVTEIDLSKFDTPNLTNAVDMFCGDPNLKSALIGKLDLSNANASGVVNFFNGDTKLSTVDLGPKWKFMTTANDWGNSNTANSNMLEAVPTTGGYDGTWNDEYTSLDLAKSWTGSMQNVYSWTVEKAVPNAHVYAVYNNGTLTFIQSTDTPTLNTDNISVESTNGSTYTGRIFEADGSWSSLNSQIKTVNLTTKVTPSSTNSWFDGCTNLTSVKNAQRFDMSNNTDMSDMFAHCGSLTKISGIENWDVSHVKNFDEFLFECTSIGNMDLSKWDVSSATSMYRMFSMYGTSNHTLTSLGDLSNWDVSHVTNFIGFVENDTSLVNLDVSKWDTGNATNMDGMFYGCSSLANLDVSKWDTSKVTNMGGMFGGAGCSNLTNLDVSKWDTSNVTNMSWMFQNCSSLTNLDVSNWDTSKVTNMNFMFINCSSLANLDVSKWDTGNATSMCGMFLGCSSLTNLDVSNWDTSKVTSSDNMFLGTTKLQSLTLGSKFNINSTNTGLTDNFDQRDPSLYPKWVRTSDGMIKSSNDLMTMDASARVGTWAAKKSHVYAVYNNGTLTFIQTVDTPTLNTDNISVKSTNGNTYTGRIYEADGSWSSLNSQIKTVDLTTKVTPLSTNSWFDGCTNLTSVNNAQLFDMSNNTDMGAMFRGCSSLASLDVSNWDTSKVINMRAMFLSCSNLANLDVSNWDTGKAIDMGWMFQNCNKLASVGDLSKWDTSKVTDMSWMFQNCQNLSNLDASKWNTGKVTNMTEMFYGCSSLTNLDVSKWDTGNVTNMRGMFANCPKLTNLDVSKWNTSKVIDMGWMFYGGSSLTNLDVSKWDTSKATNMDFMFYGDFSLTNLDVSKWDTSNVTNMHALFYGCPSLANLDVSNWDTSKVIDMSWMFNGCSSLAKLDVSKWDTSKVTNMNGMFYGCSSLVNLDVSKWDTSQVTNMGLMFASCFNLTNLDVSNWDTSNAANMDNMFNNCSSLTNLDVSNWDTSKVTNSYNMFSGTTKLQSLTLGSKFNINSTSTGLADDFNKRDSSLYSKWVRTSDDMVKSSNDLMTMNANSRVGTWTAKKMTATIDITDSNKKTVLESSTMDNYKTIVDKWAHRGYTVGTSNVPPALDPYAPSYKMTYTVYMNPNVSTYSISTTTPKGTYMFKDGKQVGTKTVNLTITMNGGAYFTSNKMSDVINQVMSQTPAGWNVESTKYTITDGYGNSQTTPQGGYTVVYSVEFTVDQDKVTKNYGEFSPVLPTDHDSYDVTSGGSIKITLPDVYTVTSLATRTSPVQDTVYAFYKLTAVRTGNHSTLGNLTFTDGKTGGYGLLDGGSVGNYVTVHMPIDWSHANNADSYKWYESHMSFEYVNNYDNPDMAVVGTDNHMFDVTWYKHNPILFDDTNSSKQQVPYCQINILGNDSKSFDTITLHNTYSFLQNSSDYLTAKAGYGIEYPYQVMQQFYDESGNTNNKEPNGYATTSNLYDNTLTSDINHEELRFYTSSEQLHDVPANTSNEFAQLNAQYGSLFYPMQFQTLTNITARSKLLRNGFQAYADGNYNNKSSFNSPSNVVSGMMLGNNRYDPDHRHCDYIKDNVEEGIYPLNINANIGEVTVNKNFKIQIYGSRMASKDRSDGEISIDGTLSGTTINTTDKLKNQCGITDEEAEQLKEFLKN